MAFFHCSFSLHICFIDRAAVEPIIGQGIDRLPGNTIVLKFDVRPDPIWKAEIISLWIAACNGSDLVFIAVYHYTLLYILPASYQEVERNKTLLC